MHSVVSDVTMNVTRGPTVTSDLRSKPVPSFEIATSPMTGCSVTVSMSSGSMWLCTRSVTVTSVCAPNERASCSTGRPTSGAVPPSAVALLSQWIEAEQSSPFSLSEELLILDDDAVAIAADAETATTTARTNRTCWRGFIAEALLPCDRENGGIEREREDAIVSNRTE